MTFNNHLLLEDVPNVVFLCQPLFDRPTSHIAIYFGGADTITALAFGYVQEVVDFIKTTSEL